jgi:predicted metal-dependent peptidase
VAVGIDASSSVDDARLSMFMGQVAGIARRTAAELHVIVFDEEVRSIARVPPGGAESWLRRQPLARGGGTRFDDLFAKAEGLDLALLIVLTDLEAPMPRPPRGVPLLWAVPAAPRTPPPHGRVIDLSA